MNSHGFPRLQFPSQEESERNPRYIFVSTDTVECELQKLKEYDAEVDKVAALGVKQRTKALWSADEKNLFFEALNEYGKDFDSITAYICNKMKKKGLADCHLKTKNQVSHFYYRTWQKLSKHVHFDESEFV